MNIDTEQKGDAGPEMDAANWRTVVMRYACPSRARSGWQLANTLIPYLVLMAAMFWARNVSYALMLLLAIPTAGLCVRLFIIAHDCGHRSFFKSRRWNDFWGKVTSFFVWTPYDCWCSEHAQHHASSGNLDRRGTGDIGTLTVDEYRALPWWGRIHYRIYRNPVILFVIGPVLLFTIAHRFTPRWAGKAERLSVLRTNLYLTALLAVMHWTVGLQAFLIVQLPVLIMAASAGVWLFYVQHQFENVYWAKDADWDFFSQAIRGSSFYQLPRVLQWFTGSIGYHHVHHLSPRIPNYRLEQCHRENSIFHTASRITLQTSRRCLRFRLWDAAARRMVGYKALRVERPSRQAADAGADETGMALT